jgi:hypothetical protein
MCSRTDASTCAYSDGGGYSCDTVWCPDHGTVIDRVIYCRRHAGIISALKASKNDGHVPDIENRAPSLANLVAADLDARIHRILTEAMTPGGHERVVTEPLTHVLTAYRTHLWERWWKLLDGVDVVLKVGVDVDESNDEEIRIRVGNRALMSVTPPWIGRRYNAAFTSDKYAREEFYDMLTAAIAEAVGVQR